MKELDLSNTEMCLVVRRRSGLSQRDVAAKVKCSRRWVNLMEQGAVDCARLIRFWNNSGFLGC